MIRWSWYNVGDSLIHREGLTVGHFLTYWYPLFPFHILQSRNYLHPLSSWCLSSSSSPSFLIPSWRPYGFERLSARAPQIQLFGSSPRPTFTSFASGCPLLALKATCPMDVEALCMFFFSSPYSRLFCLL